MPLLNDLNPLIKMNGGTGSSLTDVPNAAFVTNGDGESMLDRFYRYYQSTTITGPYTIQDIDVARVIRVDSNSGDDVVITLPSQDDIPLGTGFNFYLLVIGDDTAVLTPEEGGDSFIGNNEVETGQIVQVILTNVSGSSNEWTISLAPSYGYTSISSSTGSVLQNPLFNIYDITMTAASQKVQLPDMHIDNSPKIGQIFYIRNAGPTNSFNIVLNDGSTVLYSGLLPGAMIAIWLTNNNSSSGVLSYQVYGTLGQQNASNVNVFFLTATGVVTLSNYTGILTGNAASDIVASPVTQHGVLVGGASNAVSSTSVGATGTVLAGVTGANPSFSNTPTVTSISFGGSALGNYVSDTTFTPTITGASTAGTTTYSSQSGYYTRIGSRVFFDIVIGISSMTGTGNIVLGGLPFTIKNQSGYQPSWIARLDGITLPVGSIELICQGTSNSTTALFVTDTVAGSGANVQMANVGAAVYVSGSYEI